MGFCTLIYVCFTVSEVGWEREHRALEEGARVAERDS